MPNWARKGRQMYITMFNQNAPRFGCFFGENKHGPLWKHVMCTPKLLGVIWPYREVLLFPEPPIYDCGIPCLCVIWVRID